MSIDRCSRCGDLVDTDDEPESYVQIADMRKREEWICLCRHHREQWEAEHDEPPEREFSPAQQAFIDKHEATSRKDGEHGEEDDQ